MHGPNMNVYKKDTLCEEYTYHMKTEKNRIIPERRNYDEKMNEDDEAAAAIFLKLTNKGNFGGAHCMYT